MRSGGMEAVRDSVLERFFSASFRAAHPAIIAEYSAQLLATNVDGYCAACAVLRDTDLHLSAPRIGAPTLIIAGEYDEATPLAQATQLQSLIAGSQLYVVPQAGHLSNIEQPVLFTTALQRFLL